ncbi:MAG: hypothetical protein E5X58_44665, partial [Mesorhizobium sp.]
MPVPAKVRLDSVLKVLQKALERESRPCPEARRSWHAGDVAITDSRGRVSAMTNREVRLSRGELKAFLLSDEDGFRKVLQTVVQEALEAEMTEAIGAEKGERTTERVGYRSGYYERKLVT